MVVLSAEKQQWDRNAKNGHAGEQPKVVTEGWGGRGVVEERLPRENKMYGRKRRSTNNGKERKRISWSVLHAQRDTQYNTENRREQQQQQITEKKLANKKNQNLN